MLRYLEHPLNLPAYQHSFHLSSIPLVLPAVVSRLLLVGLQLFSQGITEVKTKAGGAQICNVYVEKKQQKQEGGD